MKTVFGCVQSSTLDAAAAAIQTIVERKRHSTAAAGASIEGLRQFSLYSFKDDNSKQTKKAQ
jgi:hypothetical protein